MCFFFKSKDPAVQQFLRNLTQQVQQKVLDFFARFQDLHPNSCEFEVVII